MYLMLVKHLFYGDKINVIDYIILFCTYCIMTQGFDVSKRVSGIATQLIHTDGTVDPVFVETLLCFSVLQPKMSSAPALNYSGISH